MTPQDEERIGLAMLAHRKQETSSNRNISKTAQRGPKPAAGGWKEGQPRQLQRKLDHQQVLNVLRIMRTATSAKISEKITGMNQKKVTRILRGLRDDGKVVLDGTIRNHTWRLLE